MAIKVAAKKSSPTGSSKTPAKSSSGNKRQKDACDLLDADHQTVLGEYIDHHVKEERSEMFPKVRKTKLDLVGLGAQMEQRKQALMAARGNAGRPAMAIPTVV